jgi:hypothetical protein
VTTFRKSTDEEIAAHFGRSTSAIDYVLRQAGVRIKTASAHASGVKGEAIEDQAYERRLDSDAEACALHLRDLQRGYPKGAPWAALPTSHEPRAIKVLMPQRFSTIGSPAAMCEG